MKKDIKEKILKLAEKASTVYDELEKDSKGESIKNLVAARQEISDWLREYSGISKIIELEEKEKLNQLIGDAAKSIMIAAKMISSYNQKIVAYLKREVSSEKVDERDLNDYEQLSILSVNSACDKVRKIEKFNKKRNREEYLNVAICKFKKLKGRVFGREQDSEEQSKN